MAQAALELSTHAGTGSTETLVSCTSPHLMVHIAGEHRSQVSTAPRCSSLTSRKPSHLAYLMVYSWSAAQQGVSAGDERT